MEAIDAVVVERGVAGLAATACVRVHDAAGEVAGSGFAVGPDLVATCAHVVAAATGHDPYSASAPGGRVAVEFPMLPGRPAGRTARVHRWVPIAEDGTGDVALLRLDVPAPAGAVMPPVRRVDGLWDHRFRVFGFPVGRADGVWTTGRIRDRQATGWFQLQGTPGDQPIVGGFSGAPVWDDESGAVVGMTVAADRDPDVTTAYLIPVDQVLGLDPELLPNPYRGLAPFGEEHAEYFFGRDGELARLRTAVSRCALVAVVGPSGAGKSSLVHAGLVPVLRSEGARIGQVRTSAGPSVFADLVAAVLALSDPTSNSARRAADTTRIAGVLADPPTRDTAVEELTTAVAGAVGERLVLVLDQFEELAETDPDTARDLLALLAALGAVDADVRIVLTVRGGVLDEVLTPDIAEALGSGTVLIGPMDRAALRDAIVRPAERAPGLAFDEGLVDRILDDAGTEPGQLPLVESLLAGLWARREGGRLTVAGYEAAGGVAGALAAHAEDVAARLPTPDRERLPALLTRLVVPGRDGRFVRRAIRYAELPSELRALVPPLVAGRLLVVAGGERTGGTVDLAHQSLIEHWPALRDRLDADREFLVWRAELDGALNRWEVADRDAGALLRGPALAVADSWADRHGELTAEETHFLRASRDQRLLDTRRRRGLVAVVAVLTLVAGVLTAVALERGGRITAQQATAHAEALAAEATARAERQPALAAELSLAAQRSDPTNTAAANALADSYLAFADTDKIISTQDYPLSIAGGGDAVTAIVGEDKAAVFTGVLGPDPQRHDIPFPIDKVLPSNDGRYVAVLAADGSVHLVDVARDLALVQLAAPRTGRQLIDFDPTSTRFGWSESDAADRPVLTVHDLGSGTGRTTVVSQSGVGNLGLTADPDLVVVQAGTQDNQSITVRSLAADAVIRDVTRNWLVNESYELRCDPAAGTAANSGTIIASDIVSGAEKRRISMLSDCGSFWATGDSGYAFERFDAIARHDLWRATDIESGQSYQFVVPRMPPVPDAARRMAAPKVVMSTAPDGSVFGLVAVGGTLLRVRAAPEPVSDDPDAMLVRGVAGKSYIAFMRDSVSTFDTGSGRRVASVPKGSATARYILTDDVWLAQRARDRWELTRYDPPALTPGPRIELPPGEGISVVINSTAGGADQVVLGMVDGTLGAWDARSGAPLGAPIELARTPGERQWYRDHEGLVMSRDDDPRQAIVSTPDGTLQIWDVPAGSLVREFSLADLAFGQAVASGERLVTLTGTDAVEIWDLGTGQRLGDPMPAPGIGALLGFDAEGHLASTHGQHGQQVVLYDIERRAEAAAVSPKSVGPTVMAEGRAAYVAQGDFGILPRRIAGTADHWRDHLCGLLPARPSTAAQELLPPGVEPFSQCG